MASLDKGKLDDAENEFLKEAGVADLECVMCGDNFSRGAFWNGKTFPSGSYVGFCVKCVREGRMGDFVADALLVAGYTHHIANGIDAALEQTRARAWECAARRLQKKASELEKEARNVGG